MISHSKDQFVNGLNKKENFIIFKKFSISQIDPTQFFIEYTKNKKYGFLFESVEKEVIRGRYTICGHTPQMIIKDENKILSIKSNKTNKKINNKNPLIVISELIKSLKFKNSNKLPSMCSAFYGYFGYETIHYVENISAKKKKDDLKLPNSILFLPKFIIVFDNKELKITISSPVISRETKISDYELIKNEFSKLEKNILKKLPTDKINLNLRKKLNPKSNISKTRFIKNIKKAKEYIKNGDIFQVVLGQRFKVHFKKKAVSLYKILRITNPSPFMFFFNFPSFNIVGSSPEILVRVQNSKITIRPIAGTRPRGKNKKIDKNFEKELLNDQKELSEHLMLLDLGRNDVGKVSKKSSVKVTSSFFIERYSHVMHIVSNVEGFLKNGISSIQALMSGFPAGTVSGAPKIRAMQIIDELEQTKRGVYAGGIGYLSTNNNMDTCIALRTCVIKNHKLYVQSGGGIVYDSNPDAEYEESVNKAKAIINAAEISLGNNI